MTKLVAKSPCPYCGEVGLYAVHHRAGKVFEDPNGRFWYCPHCRIVFGRAYKKDPHGENLV